MRRLRLDPALDASMTGSDASTVSHDSSIKTRWPRLEMFDDTTVPIIPLSAAAGATATGIYHHIRQVAFIGQCSIRQVILIAEFATPQQMLNVCRRWNVTLLRDGPFIDDAWFFAYSTTSAWKSGCGVQLLQSQLKTGAIQSTNSYSRIKRYHIMSRIAVRYRDCHRHPVEDISANVPSFSAVLYLPYPTLRDVLTLTASYSGDALWCMSASATTTRHGTRLYGIHVAATAPRADRGENQARGKVDRKTICTMQRPRGRYHDDEDEEKEENMNNMDALREDTISKSEDDVIDDRVAGASFSSTPLSERTPALNSSASSVSMLPAWKVARRSRECFESGLTIDSMGFRCHAMYALPAIPLGIGTITTSGTVDVCLKPGQLVDHHYHCTGTDIDSELLVMDSSCHRIAGIGAYLEFPSAFGACAPIVLYDTRARSVVRRFTNTRATCLVNDPMASHDNTELIAFVAPGAPRSGTLVATTHSTINILDTRQAAAVTTSAVINDPDACMNRPVDFSGYYIIGRSRNCMWSWDRRMSMVVHSPLRDSPTPVPPPLPPLSTSFMSIIPRFSVHVNHRNGTMVSLAQCRDTVDASAQTYTPLVTRIQDRSDGRNPYHYSADMYAPSGLLAVCDSWTCFPVRSDAHGMVSCLKLIHH